MTDKNSKLVSHISREPAPLIQIAESANVIVPKGLELRLDGSYIPRINQKRSILPNGLTVITEYAPPEFPYHGFEPMAKFYAWGAGIFTMPTSVAHALEHMLVERSTKELDGEGYIKIADRHGSLSNAEVFARFSEYYCRPTRGFVIKLLRPLLEQTFDALVLPEEYEIEVEPIKDEVRIFQSDSEVFPNLLARGNLFGVEPFVLYETGPISCIEKLTINDLLDFKKRFYYPANMTLHVVDSVEYAGGDVEYRATKFHHDVVRVVIDFFASRAFENPARHNPDIYHPTVSISSNVSARECVNIADSFYSRARKDTFQDDPRRDLIVELLRELLDRRAWVHMRMRLGTGYHVDYQYTEQPENSLVFNATCSPENFERMYSASMGVEDGLVKSGFSPEELQLQKARLLHKVDDKYGHGSSIIQFEKDARLGEPLSYRGQKTGLESITLEEVNQVARQILGQPFSEAYMGRRI